MPGNERSVCRAARVASIHTLARDRLGSSHASTCGRPVERVGRSRGVARVAAPARPLAPAPRPRLQRGRGPRPHHGHEHGGLPRIAHRRRLPDGAALRAGDDRRLRGPALLRGDRRAALPRLRGDGPRRRRGAAPSPSASGHRDRAQRPRHARPLPAREGGGARELDPRRGHLLDTPGGRGLPGPPLPGGEAELRGAPGGARPLRVRGEGRRRRSHGGGHALAAGLALRRLAPHQSWSCR